MHSNVVLRRFSALASAAIIVLLGAMAQAQTHSNLFRQRPVTGTPGSPGVAAYVGDIDEGALTAGPAGLTIVVPGKPDLAFDREGHERRGARSIVWRGRGQLDRGNVTLTLHEGLLYGRVESGSDVYAIRPGPNNRTLVEKINSDSFAPEWGHDAATHGHEKVPPPTGGDTLQQGSFTAPNAAAADGTVQIVLMSVYTPQARAAAGGTTQIQAQIQAAVDQANTAFVNSNMMPRFFLSHTEEVPYNDSGNIETDLNWVTSNATVGYAFQVTALGCLANSTLAHEHGHNMGMEHDPASAGISPSGASYPWSFGHYVNGSFRTIMSYNVCSISCPRVLHFSNPDVLYNGIPTGIVDKRDNAQTGDLTAPIVANFRLGGGSANNPPAFTSDPIVKPDAIQGQAFSSSIASNAGDLDTDPLTFAKTSGPAWLVVASNGALNGTPAMADLGLNNFTVSVSDGRGGSDTAALQITVVAALSAPTNLIATPAGAKKIDLRWIDNSSGESGFKIERSSNKGKSYSQIATMSGNATTFSDLGLRSGRIYYYRVRAYTATNNSAYSNIAGTTAQ